MWISSESRGSGNWLCTASVFEIFFDFRRERSSMFRKSVLPPVFNWYVRLSFTPLSAHSLASVRWSMVAPSWAFTSSPTTGMPASVKRARPFGVRDDEDRHAVDEGNARCKRCFGVMARRLLRTHGHEVQ